MQPLFDKFTPKRKRKPVAGGRAYFCRCGRPVFFRNSICLGLQDPARIRASPAPRVSVGARLRARVLADRDRGGQRGEIPALRQSGNSGRVQLAGR